MYAPSYETVEYPTFEVLYQHYQEAGSWKVTTESNKKVPSLVQPYVPSAIHSETRIGNDGLKQTFAHDWDVPTKFAKNTKLGIEVGMNTDIPAWSFIPKVKHECVGFPTAEGKTSFRISFPPTYTHFGARPSFDLTMQHPSATLFAYGEVDGSVTSDSVGFPMGINANVTVLPDVNLGMFVAYDPIRSGVSNFGAMFRTKCPFMKHEQFSNTFAYLKYSSMRSLTASYVTTFRGQHQALLEVGKANVTLAVMMTCPVTGAKIGKKANLVDKSVSWFVEKKIKSATVGVSGSLPKFTAPSLQSMTFGVSIRFD